MIIKVAHCTECGVKWQVEGEADYRCPECDSRAVEINTTNRAPSIAPGFHIEDYD